MPGRHPDDDVLADLAADVLPPVDARAVEAHVMECERCAALLEDAERVRGLLLAGDPGPVPPQVWQRIEAALAAEATSGRAGHHGVGAQAPAAPDAGPDTAAFQAFVHAPDGDGRPPTAEPLPPAPTAPARGTPGWTEDADPLDDPVRWAAPRALRGGGASRRRDARTDGARRRTPVLLAAAAAVVLVAVVGGVVRLAGRGDSTASFTAAEGGAAAAGGGQSTSPATGGNSTVVLKSGRAYREKTLAKEAGAIRAATLAATAEVPGAAPKSSRTLSRQSPGKLDAAADDLSNPTKLSACLTALNVAQDRLVAVDLATYEGREAAILLLRTADGGYEVWAVERTCAPGSEGALKYTRLSD